MAVDADDHLCRQILFRFNFSEMRFSQMQADCTPTPLIFPFVRVE